MDTIDSELYKFACLGGRVGKLADALVERDAPYLELKLISAFVQNWLEDSRDDDPRTRADSDAEDGGVE